MKLLLALWIIGCTVSCASGGTNNHGSVGQTAAFLPYVEYVETNPAIVYEDDPYEIVVHLSSQLNPNLLCGLPDRDWERSTNWPWIPEFFSFGPSADNPDIHVNVYNPWITQPVFQGEVTSTIVIANKPGGSQVGTHVVRLYTADSREWGGLESIYYSSSGAYVPKHPHAIYRDFEITVLPAEE